MPAVEHVLKLGLRFHNNQTSTQVNATVSRAERGSDFVQFVIFQLGPALLNTAVGATYFSGKYGLDVAAVLFSTAIAHYISTFASRPKQMEIAALRRDGADEQNARRADVLANMDVVKNYCLEEHESGKYRDKVSEVHRIDFEHSLLATVQVFSQDLIKDVGILCGAALISRRIANGTLHIDDFVAFVTYAATTLSTGEVAYRVKMTAD